MLLTRSDINAYGLRGIAFDSAYASNIHEIEDGWNDDFELAMDAQQPLITTANAGVPAFLTNLMDPEVVRILTAPMAATEIFGESKAGDWTTFSIEMPIIESTGLTSTYGDFNNNGNAGFNVIWEPRQSYHFQVVSQWGERDMEKYGKAKIGYVSEINIASALTLMKFQNKTYFYGVSGLRLYGALNDPGLPASISPNVKQAGGLTWANGTALENYGDVLKLFGQLQTQLGGILSKSAKMTLSMSPTLEVQLLKASVYNVTVEEMLRKAYPNLTVKTAPEYSTPSGELMQLKLDQIDGVDTAAAKFTEKQRAHAVVTDLSGWKQKKSAGTWGTIIKRPVAIASMLGM